MSMVVTPETQHELAPMVRLAEDLGVDSVYVGVDFLAAERLDRPLIERQVRDVIERRSVPTNWDRIGMMFPDLIRTPSVTEPCRRDREAFYIEVNGDAFVCCHSHLPIGSLRDNDVETLWKSPAAYAVERDVSSGQCATCPQDCIYRPATLRPAPWSARIETGQTDRFATRQWWQVPSPLRDAVSIHRPRPPPFTTCSGRTASRRNDGSAATEPASPFHAKIFSGIRRSPVPLQVLTGSETARTTQDDRARRQRHDRQHRQAPL
jgi:hypothetical protein